MENVRFNLDGEAVVRGGKSTVDDVREQRRTGIGKPSSRLSLASRGRLPVRHEGQVRQPILESSVDSRAVCREGFASLGAVESPRTVGRCSPLNSKDVSSISRRFLYELMFRKIRLVRTVVLVYCRQQVFIIIDLLCTFTPY